MELEQIVEAGKIAGIAVLGAAALTITYLGMAQLGAYLMERVYARKEARHLYNESQASNREISK